MEYKSSYRLYRLVTVKKKKKLGLINSSRPGYVSSPACLLFPLFSLFSGEGKLHFYFCCNSSRLSWVSCRGCSPETGTTPEDRRMPAWVYRAGAGQTLGRLRQTWAPRQLNLPFPLPQVPSLSPPTIWSQGCHVINTWPSKRQLRVSCYGSWN